MGFPDDDFPSRPYFSCEADKLRIVDRMRLSQVISGKEEAWLTLAVGEQNVMHSRPVRVVSHRDFDIEIECEKGKLKLDMESESARKVDTTGKEWVYCGGLDEANAGLGWMPVS